MWILTTLRLFWINFNINQYHSNHRQRSFRENSAISTSEIVDTNKNWIIVFLDITESNKIKLQK